MKNKKKWEKVFHGKFQVSKGFKKSVSKRRSSGCTIEAQKCTSVASLIQNISSSWQIFVGRKESRKQVIYLCPQLKLIKMFLLHYNSLQPHCILHLFSNKICHRFIDSESIFFIILNSWMPKGPKKIHLNLIELNIFKDQVLSIIIFLKSFLILGLQKGQRISMLYI